MTTPTLAKRRISYENMTRSERDIALHDMAETILKILRKVGGTHPTIDLMHRVADETGYNWHDVRYGLNYGDAERLFDDNVATSEVRLIAP